MKVAEVLQNKGSQISEIGTEVVKIGENSTVGEAVEKLVDHNIGSLVVVGSKGKISGIITERDILRKYSEFKGSLEQKPIPEVMTTNVIFVQPSNDVEYIKKLMTNNRVRHLPVMKGDELIGIISIGDVLKAEHDKCIREEKSMEDYITGKYPG